MTLTLTLPDQSTHTVQSDLTGFEVIQQLVPHLQSKALAYTLDNILYDLRTPITHKGTFHIVTADTPQGMEILRHDTAHLLGHAVQDVYPDAKLGFGPATENGFYYDFLTDTPISSYDLPVIEKRMQKLQKDNLPITKTEVNRDVLIHSLLEKGQRLKAEAVEKISEPVTVYTEGSHAWSPTENAWWDICRGPHAMSTGKPKKYFTLTKVSGAYWLGNSKNQPLTRIYGVVFSTKEAKEAYLIKMKEAKLRDHRLLGRQMDLFHFQNEAPGQIFWHPNGWTLYRLLEEYMRKKWVAYKYQEINTPQIMNRELWEKSGHWSKFDDNMFTLKDDDMEYALKPMNCPGHIQVYKRTIVSYKSLPIRFAEFGSCVRNEPTGALAGAIRTRAFCQDDAHIFCRQDQIFDEIKSFCKMLADIYADLGFIKYHVLLSTRPDVRAGSNTVWDLSENILLEASKAAGLNPINNPGEGAFYGPKLEFVLEDSLSREWQCGTIQVDFILPERLSAEYVDQNGHKQFVTLLHRAIFGSMERFISILLEHTGGHLPIFFAPIQAVVMSITQDIDVYAQEVFELLSPIYRVNLDTDNEKISYKIRKYSEQKIPLMLIVGRNEAKQHTVTLRQHNKPQETVAISQLNDILNTLNNRSLL